MSLDNRRTQGKTKYKNIQYIKNKVYGNPTYFPSIAVQHVLLNKVTYKQNSELPCSILFELNLYCIIFKVK